VRLYRPSAPTMHTGDGCVCCVSSETCLRDRASGRRQAQRSLWLHSDFKKMERQRCILCLPSARCSIPARQVSLLTQQTHPLPCDRRCGRPIQPHSFHPADVKVATNNLCVALKGPQTEAHFLSVQHAISMRLLRATSHSSMTALEAALSRCAIMPTTFPISRIWATRSLLPRE